MICPRCYQEYEGTFHNCPEWHTYQGVSLSFTSDINAELAALRADRDRYARALRRVVRHWMECGEHSRWWDQARHLHAREATGLPWRESWGER